jgi:exodeoxyribonuclease VII large subunit
MVVQDRRELAARVQSLTRVLGNALAEKLRFWRQRLERLTRSAVLQQPRRVFEPLAQRLDELRGNLQQLLAHRLNLGTERLRGLTAELEALSPLKVMGRGYSLVYREPGGELMRSAKELNAGDALRIRLARGEVFGRVEKVAEK